MKKRTISIIVVGLLCLVILVQALPFNAALGAEETLEILNPKGNIEQLKIQGLSERVDSLEGKRIGLWAYSKDATGSLNARAAVAELLQEMYPADTGTTIVNYWTAKGGVAYNEAIASYDQYARDCDVVIMGVAN